MKKNSTLISISFFLFSFFFLLPSFIFAVSKPATPSATKAVSSKIDDLKERLATKVAELRKTTPRAVFGTVTQVSVSSLTVDTTEKALKIELTDDIKVAQMLKGKRTALDIEDVEKNDVVTIFGDYDETLDILQAKKIFIETSKLPVRLHGTISAVDKKNNAFTLKGIDEASYTIDVEAATKNNIWTKEKGIEKSGFSRLETGMFVTVVGLEDTKKSDTYIAQRILTMKLEGSALGESTTPTPTVETTPTATPKVTVKPTVKVTATPTKKVTPSPTKKVMVTPKSTP